jgi:cytosine/adenosine deaminase-related metal-dependent hydrolase
VILRGATIVGGGPDPVDVVVTGERIERVGPPGGAADSTGHTVVDVGGAMAFPGLVNSHDHLEFDLYPPLGHGPYPDFLAWGEDIHRRDGETIRRVESVPRAARARWGALKNLLAGVTAVANHGGAADARAIWPLRRLPGTSIHSVALERGWRRRLWAPWHRPPFVAHVAEGVSPAAARDADALVRWNILGRDLFAVHAIAMTPAQAARFRAVIWCPLSNEFLYGASADIRALKGRAAILFGTDSTLSGPWSFWDHLRRARAIGALDDASLFAAVTDEASRLWDAGAGDAGPARRIAPGAVADLVVARRGDGAGWDGFYALEPGDIRLVLRGGTPVLADDAVGVVVVGGSRISVGGRPKTVAMDVPGLLATIRACGVVPNIEIGAP